MAVGGAERMIGLDEVSEIGLSQAQVHAEQRVLYEDSQRARAEQADGARGGLGGPEPLQQVAGARDGQVAQEHPQVLEQQARIQRQARMIQGQGVEAPVALYLGRVEVQAELDREAATVHFQNIV